MPTVLRRSRSAARPHPAKAVRFVLAVLALGLGLGIASFGISACGSGTVRSPFAGDAGSEAGAAGATSNDEGGLNVGVDAGDPTLGGPCEDDGQCDDGLPCTNDHCEPDLHRCRHSPDDSQCADPIYCNGEEVCDPKLGCRPGPAVTCADSDPCTIDTCVEKTQSCAYVPRDADGDGDPIWNCEGGGDCDDTDPSISSLAKEVCGNGKDDNCDGQIDEKGCVNPAYDVCPKSLTISESGLTSLSLTATKLDYPSDCAPSGKKGLGDVVVVIHVPDGDDQNVDLVAQSSGASVSLATVPNCGKPSGVECAPGLPAGKGSLARLRLYSLSPGNHTIYVAGIAPSDVALSVTYSDATERPSNETCGTAAPLVPGESQTVTLIDAAIDLTSACDPPPPEPDPNPPAVDKPQPVVPSWTAGELVYSFTLDEPRDVRVFASPLDPYGTPLLSLRRSACTTAASELTCRSGTPTAALFARALPAGVYYLSVSASGPTEVDVRLEESEPTDAPEDEGCAAPPVLPVAQSVDLTLADHADAVTLGCLAGAPDSTHRLTLAGKNASDVLLVERISEDDTGAVSLALPTCAASSRLACGSSGVSPVRARAYGVAPGTYSVVAESAAGTPITLTAFTRQAVPATLVPWADDCSAPFEIPETGGRFKGSTANAHADFSAGCDGENQGTFGAPDQILHLALKTKSRVVLDMAGSTYQTMLSVRSGDSCPGSELELACAAGYQASRSFLDLDLDPGDYYVQVDGYLGASGAWSLDVYVTPGSI